MTHLSQAKAAALTIVKNPRKRRLAYLILASILIVLSIFPRYHTAKIKIVLDNPGSNGLASIIGAFGGRAQSFEALFSGSATNVGLQLARSQEITDNVIKSMNIVGPGRKFSNLRSAQLALLKIVDIHSLTGGIMVIEVKSTDGDWALAITKAYMVAINNRIRVFGLEQIENKKTVVKERFFGAAERVFTAEAALNDFRRRNRLAEPQAQLGAQLALRSSQEAQLQAKLIELETVKQIAGPDSLSIKTLQTQLAGLRSQIANSAQPSINNSGPNLGAVSNVMLEYARLYRTYVFSQTLYEVYARSMEEVSLQEIAALGSSQFAIVDPPHIDPKRQLNPSALALLALLILLTFFTEIYVPYTTLPGFRDGEDDGS
jgi:hypothetical protein